MLSSHRRASEGLFCRYKAQEITIAVILCKYSHEEGRHCAGVIAPWRLGQSVSCDSPSKARRPRRLCGGASGHERSARSLGSRLVTKVGNQSSRKNSNSHIDASHSRQPLVKGERLVRYEVNAVMLLISLVWGFADSDMWHPFLLDVSR